MTGRSTPDCLVHPKLNMSAEPDMTSLHRKRRLGRAGGYLIYAVPLANGLHLAPQLQLFQVAGRKSEPRRDRATASVSPPQSRPTVSTTMSGILPVLSP
jgi:hypothetical protein